MPHYQWRTRGGAEGAIRPGRHFEGGGKKGKKKKKEKKEERKKEKKREKENMEEACNYSKTKMEYLSCGAPVHFGADAWLGYTCFCIGR